MQGIVGTEFNPRDQFDSPSRIQAVLIEMADSLHGVMIRDGHISQPCFFCCGYEFLGRQLAIREGRMHMQITWHPEVNSYIMVHRGSTMSLMAVRSSPSISISVKAGIQMSLRHEVPQNRVR